VLLERQDWLLLTMACFRMVAACFRSVCFWPLFCNRAEPICQSLALPQAPAQERCNLMPPSWQVRSVPEDTDTAQAVRLVAGELHSLDVVVMAADLVCNVPLQARCEHACIISGLCVHIIATVRTAAYVQSLEVACGCHKVCNCKETCANCCIVCRA